MGLAWRKGSVISLWSLGVKNNATDSCGPLGFSEYISLFVCLRLQGHLHKEECFQLKAWPCDIPVKAVASVDLFSHMKGFFLPFTLSVALLFVQ